MYKHMLFQNDWNHGYNYFLSMDLSWFLNLQIEESSYLLPSTQLAKCKKPGNLNHGRKE